jgi:hypothetical protein
MSYERFHRPVAVPGLEMAGGRGAAVFTATQEVTLDSPTFTATPAFDLGGPAIVYLRLTVASFDGDGETLASDGEVDPGEIAVAVDQVEVSSEGTYWSIATQDGFIDWPSGLDAEFYSHIHTPRSLRCRVRIVDSDGQTYSGAQAPSATVRLVIEHLGVAEAVLLE